MLEGASLPVFRLKDLKRSALGGDPFAHFVQGGSGFDGGFRVSRDSGGGEGDLGEVEAEITESTVLTVLQDADSFFDFEGVAGGSA